ncbi:MAG TPA: pyrroline-5-carboxylate reductase [Kiloniellales bacterium]|jgi:pyrroline-5-carboxylate reductase|nr:pyrroline-5-carboxylate reductase [Kiloniellales bacterium]
MSFDGRPLLFLGCGKMGGAILAGLLARGVAPEQLHIIEPNREAVATFVQRGVHHHGSHESLPEDFSPALILLAVKPQVMEEALPAVGRLASPETVYVSVAAGKTIPWFAERLGPTARVVRAMPNTPAAVGRGMTVLVAGEAVTSEQRQLAADLMEAVGEIAWVEDETLLDPVTALSGGGPAYVFLMIECLAKAGEEAGLPADLARRLASETVAGAGELVRRSEGQEPEELRQNVTSPGGTTLEALKILMAPDGLQPLMTRAIAAATRRSRELAS